MFRDGQGNPNTAVLSASELSHTRKGSERNVIRTSRFNNALVHKRLHVFVKQKSYFTNQETQYPRFYDFINKIMKLKY